MTDFTETDDKKDRTPTTPAETEAKPDEAAAAAPTEAVPVEPAPPAAGPDPASTASPEAPPAEEPAPGPAPTEPAEGAAETVPPEPAPTSDAEAEDGLPTFWPAKPEPSADETAEGSVEAMEDGACLTPVAADQATVPGQAADAAPAEEQYSGVTPVVGVKFQRACKTYFFNAVEHQLSIGEQVIVETDRGLGLARVVTPVVELQSDKVTAQLKRVIRKAQWNDLERDRKNREREHEALKICQEKIKSHRLDMKLVRVEYLHDASKAVFFFTAETRVDFRELVKDLARQLHTRIEMRQIGVRDESKIVGGIGPCGREICCSTFLTDFIPVSVRMAKDQNLAMNPGKVSGLCGRLMCCLSYEHQLYQEQVKKMPKKGKTLRCNDGPCRIIDLNILAAKVLVELESGKTMFIPAAELRPLDQLDPILPEPKDEPAEADEDLLNSDDPNALEQKPQPTHRPEKPRRDGRPSEPAPGRPHSGPPPRRDDRRREGRRDDHRHDRRPAPDRPEQDRTRPPDRPQPPPSTVPYTGKPRPSGQPRSDRPDQPDRHDRHDRPHRGPEHRPDERRGDRQGERRDRPNPPPAGTTPHEGPPPGTTPAGEPRPHHHGRRRRKNH